MSATEAREALRDSVNDIIGRIEQRIHDRIPPSLDALDSWAGTLRAALAALPDDGREGLPTEQACMRACGHFGPHLPQPLAGFVYPSDARRCLGHSGCRRASSVAVTRTCTRVLR